MGLSQNNIFIHRSFNDGHIFEEHSDLVTERDFINVFFSGILSNRILPEVGFVETCHHIEKQRFARTERSCDDVE